MRNTSYRINSKPKSSNVSRGDNSINISSALAQTLSSAEIEAKRLKDEYISVEHILLGIIDKPGDYDLGNLLVQKNISKSQIEILE